MQCTRTRSALQGHAQGYAGGPLCATQTLRGSAGTCSQAPSVAIGRRRRGRAHKKRDVPISALPLGITDGHDPLSGFGVGFSSAAYLDGAHPTAGAWHWPWRKYNNTAEAQLVPTQSQPGPLPPRQIVSGRAMDTVRQRVKDFGFVKVRTTSAPSQRGSCPAHFCPCICSHRRSIVRAESASPPFTASTTVAPGPLSAQSSTQSARVFRLGASPISI